MLKNSELHRIPSIELQLVRWFSLVDANRVQDCVDLKRDGSKIYVKRSRQHLPGFGDGVRVFTLSNVFVNPRRQGKGWFTGFLELCDALNPWAATYVESVQNARLPQFLRRQGFIEIQHKNFYRPSKKWRSQHTWTAQQAAEAQALADRAHVPSIWDDPEAAARLAFNRAFGPPRRPA